MKVAAAAAVVVVTAIYRPDILEAAIKTVAGAAIGAAGGLVMAGIMFLRANDQEKPAISFLPFVTVPAGAAIGAVAIGIFSNF